MMVVEVTRTGGIANLRRHVRIDSDELPSEQRDHLSALVSRLDLDELEERSPMRGRGADRFEYDIVVTEQGRERHVVVDESRLSRDLQKLLELLLDGRRG
jgi:hypothetical protein